MPSDPILILGSGPAPEEILMALRVLDTDKISLKSGFDKYLAVTDKGKVAGRSDAIGPREQWEPIWQDVCAIKGVATVNGRRTFGIVFPIIKGRQLRIQCRDRECDFLQKQLATQITTARMYQRKK